MPNASVLVVDDEKNILSTLSRALRIEDFDVDVAGNATIAIEKVATKAYDVLLVDVNMPGMDGIAMLDKLRADGNHVPVIVMSGHGSIDTAVAATRAGAHDYLEKPISTDRLLLSLARCLDYQRLANENKALLAKVDAGAGLLGNSPAMQALRERIALAARALGAFPDNPDPVVTRVAALLAPANAHVMRACAAEALGGMRSAVALQSLLPFLNDEAIGDAVHAYAAERRSGKLKAGAAA